MGAALRAVYLQIFDHTRGTIELTNGFLKPYFLLASRLVYPLIVTFMVISGLELELNQSFPKWDRYSLRKFWSARSMSREAAPFRGSC